jgi:DNA-binding transcriptional ArsR family regulator
MKTSVICRDIGAASDLLRAISNPNRLAIICLLLEGDRTVMELELALGIRQPTLSQQLTELRDAGLIAGRRVAKHVHYRIVDERAGKIVACLREIFSELLPASAMLAVAGNLDDRQSLAEITALTRLAERELM